MTELGFHKFVKLNQVKHHPENFARNVLDKGEMMTEEYEPVKYQDIKHNYEARMKKPTRITDNSMAMGGIVLAGIIFFLLLVWVVAS